MNLINPDSPEWAEYMGDALMAEFVKLDMLPTQAMPQQVIPMLPDDTEGA